jgi:ketosteroid isomerase-like protein/quercetin dioxygenase-like cupin family protein
MTRPTAQPVTHIDDDRFKVTEWRFAPGAETGWHVHGHDYVIVPLTDGTLGLEEPGGTVRQATLTKGVPYSRREGVHHNVTNAGQADLSFLEVETVADSLNHRRRETLIRFMAAWNARDVDALMSCMAADCAFHASAGPDAEGRRYTGRDAVRASYAAMFETFPQAAWTADSHHVMGNTGLSEWRFIGTDHNGTAVDVQGCDIFRFDGDLIALKDSYRKNRSG